MYPNPEIGMKTAKAYQREQEALAQQNRLAQSRSPENTTPDRRHYWRVIIALVALALLVHVVSTDMSSQTVAQEDTVESIVPVQSNPYRGTTDSLNFRPVNMPD